MRTTLGILPLLRCARDTKFSDLLIWRVHEAVLLSTTIACPSSNGRKYEMSNRSRAFVLSITLSAITLSAAAEDPPERSAPVDRPNIIFVYADDHACAAIGAYGSAINETPNIDRLAREGAVFSNSFVTNSICAPARAVILTGLHSHLNGVRTNADRFDGAQRTFVKLLRESGYQTAIIGKWHLKSEPTGFDHWEVLIGQGPYYNPPLKTAGGVVHHEGYTTDIITDRALRWLREQRDAEKPFLLMMQHKAPHRNWQPGPDHLRTYEDETIAEPETLFDDYTGRASPARHQEMTIAQHLNRSDLKLDPPRNLTEAQLAAWNDAYGPRNKAFVEAGLEGADLVRWKYQRYIKDYLRAIASVDDNLGRLLEYLDETGLARNTIVIYSSDQGFYLGEHGWFDKRWMYEPSLRTPLIVRWPGVVEAGSRIETMVQNLDVAPTLLDAAGVSVPTDMQGKSLLPLLRRTDDVDWARDAIYYHYFEFPAVHMVARHYGIRTKRYKLIHYYQTDEWELFDLERDPNEMSTVYDDPQYAEIRSLLERKLHELREQYGDSEGGE
jgi:arylsulfatase A-like enzyme